MTNRSKAKGTRYENEVLVYLHEAGFAEAERSAPGTSYRDFTGTGGLVVEAKCQARPRFSEWVLNMFSRHGGQRWVLVAKIGDGRTDRGYEVVVMPVADWIELVT